MPQGDDPFDWVGQQEAQGRALAATIVGLWVLTLAVAFGAGVTKGLGWW